MDDIIEKSLKVEPSIKVEHDSNEPNRAKQHVTIMVTGTTDNSQLLLLEK